jgi:hypothetical protein
MVFCVVYAAMWAYVDAIMFALFCRYSVLLRHPKFVLFKFGPFDETFFGGVK